MNEWYGGSTIVLELLSYRQLMVSLLLLLLRLYDEHVDFCHAHDIRLNKFRKCNDLIFAATENERDDDGAAAAQPIAYKCVSTSIAEWVTNKRLQFECCVWKIFSRSASYMMINVARKTFIGRVCVQHLSVAMIFVGLVNTHYTRFNGTADECACAGRCAYYILCA